MADSKQVRKLMEGVATWNQWRSENPDVPIDLRKADLRDFRKALKDKRLVHTTNDRWYVTKL